MKRIDRIRAQTQAQLDFLAAASADSEKKRRPRKSRKPSALEQRLRMSPRTRLRLQIEAENAALHARGIDLAKATDEEICAALSFTPLPPTEVTYIVGDGQRVKELPKAIYSNERKYTLPRESAEYKVRVERERTPYDVLLEKFESVMARAPRYTWKDAERDVRAYYAANAEKEARFQEFLSKLPPYAVEPFGSFCAIPAGHPALCPDPGFGCRLPRTAREWDKRIRERLYEQAVSSCPFFIFHAVLDRLEGEARSHGERLLDCAKGCPPPRAITTEAIAKLENYAAKLITRFAASAGGVQ